MLIGISQDYLYKNYTSDFVKKYARILDFNNIDYIWLNINDPDFWTKIKNIDCFIFRFPQYQSEKQIAKDILPIIENEYKIKCFPNQKTCWHFDDKVKQYFLLKSHGFPIIDTWIFYKREKAYKWAESTEYPVIFKLRGGAGSQNVIMVKNSRKAKKLIKKQFGKGIKYFGFLNFYSTSWKDKNFYGEYRKIGGKIKRLLQGKEPRLHWQIDKNYCLFQKFIPNNNFDTRVTVIGDRAYAYRRLNRSNDFRSSGSGDFDVNPEAIDLQHIEKAFEITKKLNFQSMAYDFLYDERSDSKLCEISYTFTDWMLYECPGFWDSKLNWYEGQYWPQYFHLIDLLNIPDLKQPEF